MFKYDMQELDGLFGRTRDQISFEVLLRRNAKDSDCPTPNAQGHGPGCVCHNANGVDLSLIQCKQCHDGAGPPSCRRQGFGRPVGK
jgi:hypothetical protein